MEKQFFTGPFASQNHLGSWEELRVLQDEKCVGV